MKMKKENSSAAEAVRGADQYVRLPRVDIYPDLDQPRKTFAESSLDELALSIMEQGIVQPLIVRLVKPKYRIIKPDMVNPEWRIEEADYAHEQPWVRCAGFKTDKEAKKWVDTHGGLAALTERHVIVAGERRWRASAPREIHVEGNQLDGEAPAPVIKWKGLEELPCIVRDMDEHAKFAQQWIENNARENVSAIDEAEALNRQMTARRAASPQFKAEDLAREIGVSRAALYQKMALTRLHAPVKAALLAGQITTSVASLIAMLPLQSQQEKLLKTVTDEKAWGYPYSVRDVQDIIDDEYVKPLKDAPFDQSKSFDADGVELVACAICPHRTGNLAEQFPELKSRPNICTNPTCFATKCKLHWSAKALDKANKGATVLTPAEFRKVKRDYVDGDKYEYTSGKSGTFESLMGKHKPEPVIVATEEGLKRFYKREEAVSAAKKSGVRFYHNETPEERAKHEEKRKQDELRDKAIDAFAETLLPRLAEALEKLKPDEAWKLVLSTCRESGDVAKFFAKQKNAQVRGLGTLLHANGLFNVYARWDGKWRDDHLKQWLALGIDVKKEFEAAEKQAQMALVDQTKMSEVKLLDVKPSKKGSRGKKG